MIYRFGPGVGHLNYLAVSRVGIFEFLFVPALGQYLTSISLRETGTECSSHVAHARYILQSWRSCKMRKRCVNFLFFFLFVLFVHEEKKKVQNKPFLQKVVLLQKKLIPPWIKAVLRSFVKNVVV